MLCDFVFPIIRLAKFFTKLARSSPGPRLLLPGVRALCSSIVTKEAVVSMEDQKARDGGEKAASREQHPVEIPLKSAGEAVFIYKKELVKSPGEKRIHSRRPLPPVPEAPDKDSEQRQ